MIKRAITVVFGLIVAVAISALSGPNIGKARAEPRCKSFQAIAHASLPGATDEWGGPLYGSLDGEVLLGILSGNDGVVTFRGAMGQGSGGSYTIGFDCGSDNPSECTDTLTFEVPNPVFQSPPGMIGLGHYNGNTARITGGTGRFESASGNLNFTGTFFVWPDESSPIGVFGRFNAELSGNICGAQ